MTTKYIIQGNVNFYDELYKSLDDSDDEKDNICQITGEPLIDRFVTMECGHKFNYKPLFKEIYRQKYDYGTYTVENLDNKNKHKLKLSEKDYYLKCPYCREIQFTILPFYEDLVKPNKMYKAVYGINSLDSTLPNTKKIPYVAHYSNSFHYFGKEFSMSGSQCDYVNCYASHTAHIDNTNLNYCHVHWKLGLKQHNAVQKQKFKEQKQKLLDEKKKLLEEKKKLIEQKKQVLEEKKQIKKQLLQEKQKLLEKTNAERIAKGLKPLTTKKINTNKNKNIITKTNEVIGETVIGEYVPDSDIVLCKGIIKSGPNKGKQCTSKHLPEDEYCCKHSEKYKESKKNNPTTIQALNDFINANN